MVMRSSLEHKALVAIGALDERLVAHLQIDLGMAKRTADAFAGNAGVIDFDDFGYFDGHGETHIRRRRRILTTAPGAATRLPPVFGSSPQPALAM
jgi:hypothetical protein